MEASLLAADLAWPLWDAESVKGAFELNQTDGLERGIVTSVKRPWLFGYKPTGPSNGRAVLILGGGGYVELMVGREGVAVARWLTGLGFNAFVLVHRFPNSESNPQAPLDDAHRALELIIEKGLASHGLGVCGLSSGGHLGSALMAVYPEVFTRTETAPARLSKLDFAIIGYGPISTNAKGRTIIAEKPALAPPEKQEFYDVVQPDVQLIGNPPPTFIVYSDSDPIVPVVNAHRLAEGLRRAGGSVELHIFADTPHGFALDTLGLPVSTWPSMCEAWLKMKGFRI